MRSSPITVPAGSVVKNLMPDPILVAELKSSSAKKLIFAGELPAEKVPVARYPLQPIKNYWSRLRTLVGDATVPLAFLPIRFPDALEE
jgi:hypothetical protein